MISDAALVQRRLWRTDPWAWAEHAEAHNRPLFESVLDAAGVIDGRRVLDVGCGAGLTLVLAAGRGAVPAGVDISPGLLAVARERLPEADLREGDMEDLPFADGAFDAVLGVNAFQFAGDPLRALREAARVLRPAGRLASGEPVRRARTLARDGRAPGDERAHPVRGRRRPRALRAVCAGWPGACARGRRPARGRSRRGRVLVALLIDGRAVLAILCSAGGARAKEAAGESAVRAVLFDALAQFEDRTTGVVNLDNTFRWIAACR